MQYYSTNALCDAITTAQNKIAKDINFNVVEGSQTKDLANPLLAACGQFIEPGTRSSNQRGLHGTCAAISVLAQNQSGQYNATVTRLIAYVVKRPSIEADKTKIDKDSRNIIKLSELLLAIAHVGGSNPTLDKTKRNALKALKSTYVSNRQQWPYVDGCSDVDRLPTVMALAALSAHNEIGQYMDALDSLISEMRQRYIDNAPGTPELQSEMALDVYIIYIINQHIISGTRREPDYNPTLAAIYRVLWNRLSSCLELGLEQNIEYWHDGSTFYVRVPWDICALALAAKYSLFDFYSIVSQRRLDDVLQALSSQRGFIYSYSGNNRSSRTYSELYNALQFIKTHVAYRHFILMPYLWARLRAYLGKSVVRKCVMFGTFFAYPAIFIYWMACSSRDYAAVAASVIANVFTTITFVGKKR